MITGRMQGNKMALIFLYFMAKNNEYIFTLKTKQNESNPKDSWTKILLVFQKEINSKLITFP